MEKIRRNDQCPCGSGKKYKHCCSKLVTLKPTRSEIKAFIKGTFEFMIDKNILGPVVPMIQQLSLNEKEQERLYRLLLAWAPFYKSSWQKKTLLEEYLEKHRPNHSVQVRMTAKTWLHTYPSIFEVKRRNGQKTCMIENIFTKDEREVRTLPEEIESGALVVGLFLPIDGEYILVDDCLSIHCEVKDEFLQSFKEWASPLINESKGSFQALNQAILNQPIQFALFLILFFQGVSVVDEAPYEPQTEVINLLKTKHAHFLLTDQEFATINQFFRRYCQEVSPKIKKPEIMTAALLYFFDRYTLLSRNRGLTQQKLAEIFGVTSSSISRRSVEFERFAESDPYEIATKQQTVSFVAEK